MLSKLSPGSIDKVLCIHDWLILDEEGGEGPVEGAEADIVIVDTDAYYIEDFSRDAFISQRSAHFRFTLKDRLTSSTTIIYDILLCHFAVT